MTTTPSHIITELKAVERWLADRAATTSYRYNSPMVIMTMSHLGFSVTVWLGQIRRDENNVASFEEAVAAARRMAHSIAVQIDDTALARTLGLEVAHA